jgi:hypothetical protein
MLPKKRKGSLQVPQLTQNKLPRILPEVGAAQVDGDGVSLEANHLKGVGQIFRPLLFRSAGGDRHVHPYREAFWTVLQSSSHRLTAASWQPQTIPKGLPIGKAAHPDPGVSRPGARHHGADLSEAKAQGGQNAQQTSLLVKARSQAHGIEKATPQGLDLKTIVLNCDE